VRSWANKFGPAIAANIRRRRGRPDCVWHLDEMVVRIGGKRMFMWRAVDKEGEVLDVLVQKRRNKAAALKLLRKLLKKQGFAPDAIVTDGLASYPAALRELGSLVRHQPGRLQENNRAENSTPARAKTGTKDAAVQVPGPSSALRLNPLRNLQYLCYPASSDFQKNNARVPISRFRGVERRVRRNGLNYPLRISARLEKVFLTVPA